MSKILKKKVGFQGKEDKTKKGFKVKLTGNSMESLGEN